MRLDAVLEESRHVEEEARDEDDADLGANASVSGGRRRGVMPGEQADVVERTADGHVATERHGDRDPRARQDEVVDDRRAVRLV